jgi:hypothetical protein
MQCSTHFRPAKVQLQKTLSYDRPPTTAYYPKTTQTYAKEFKTTDSSQLSTLAATTTTSTTLKNHKSTPPFRQHITLITTNIPNTINNDLSTTHKFAIHQHRHTLTLPSRPATTHTRSNSTRLNSGKPDNEAHNITISPLKTTQPPLIPRNFTNLV